MFKLNPKKVLIKTPTIYDYQANLPVEVIHILKFRQEKQQSYM